MVNTNIKMLGMKVAGNVERNQGMEEAVIVMICGSVAMIEVNQMVQAVWELVHSIFLLENMRMENSIRLDKIKMSGRLLKIENIKVKFNRVNQMEKDV